MHLRPFTMLMNRKVDTSGNVCQYYQGFNLIILFPKQIGDLFRNFCYGPWLQESFEMVIVLVLLISSTFQ